MKKALNPKKSGYAFWIHRNDEHYIGTSRFAVRVPDVTDDLRKALAAQNIYEPNKKAEHHKGNIALVDASGIQVERVLFPGEKPSGQLIETPLLHEGLNSKFRIFVVPDGSNVYVDELCLQPIKQVFPHGIWFSNQHEHSPLYLYVDDIKPVAVLMPVVMPKRNYKIEVIG